MPAFLRDACQGQDGTRLDANQRNTDTVKFPPVEHRQDDLRVVENINKVEVRA